MDEVNYPRLKKFVQNKDQVKLDYALLTLKEAIPNDQYFELISEERLKELDLSKAEICGYPLKLIVNGKVPLYKAKIDANEVIGEDWLQYDAWTAQGMSGSPVFIQG